MTLRPEERLIVAVDPKLRNNDGNRIYSTREATIAHLWEQANSACAELKGTGVVVKFNTSFRVLGYPLLDTCAEAGLRIFLDGKFFDIKNTVLNDLAFWGLYDHIDICTLAEKIDPATFAEGKVLMPNTVFCPVSPLTDLDNVDLLRWYDRDRTDEAKDFFLRTKKLVGADGLICSPSDIQHGYEGMAATRQIICPSVRNANDPVDDNSKHALTPAEAIRAGAWRIVAGRPTQDPQTGLVSRPRVDAMIGQIETAA